MKGFLGSLFLFCYHILMPQMTLLKFSFRKDKKQRWLDWCQELRARSGEVVTTLREEGIVIEGCFIAEDEDACYYLIEAEDLAKVQRLYENSTRPIDLQHKQAMEDSLQFIERLKTVFYFRR